MKNKRALYSQTLRQAAVKVGGVDSLSKKLNIRAQFLALWMQGKGLPPREIFLRAADLLSAPEDEQASK
jgi:hypothetical protein